MTLNDSLSYQADSDLAVRTRWSTISFTVLLLIVVGFSPYLTDHPYTVYWIGSLLLIGTCTRIYLSVQFEKIYQRSVKTWKNAFLVSLIWLATTWGIFCMLSVVYYELQWIAMLVILATAGLAAGAVTTISIHFYQISLQLALMLLPTTLATLTLGSQHAYAIAFMFVIFFAFLLMVAKRQHEEYWSALNNANLLDLRAQELEDSNKELESYSYSIAHDLRAPLRTITSYSQILLAEAGFKLNAEEIDSLNRVVNSSKHMAELIDDILELSRITRGELHKDTVNLSKLANECADQLTKQEPNYNVNWKIEPNLITKGDSQLLNVAMQNLIGNSWKFTHRLSKKAEIQFGSEIKQNKVVYYVKDNGIGFDMKYSDKIFSPFERLHKDYDGTGIGLATVARVIHRHGGKIWVESESNKGSTFYFTI